MPVDVTTGTEIARPRAEVAAFAADCSGLPADHEGGAAAALTQTWKLPVP